MARGCERPLSRYPVTAAQVHGADGLGGISGICEPDGGLRYPAPAIEPDGRHAVDVILDLIGQHRGQITIVALGPLTNIATAIQRDSATMAQVKELIVMGGSLHGQGNITPAAEFNFHADPEAARVMVQSGIGPTVVGLDVTQRAMLPRKAFDEATRAGGDTYTRFLRDLTANWFDFAEGRALDGAYLHDPLAIGVAIDPSFVRTKTFAADVETRGELTQGMLVADRRGVPGAGNGWPVQGCVEVDAARFVNFFLARVGIQRWDEKAGR